VKFLTLFAAACAGHLACTQQVPDTVFKAPIAEPRHPIGQGPVVTLDEAHYNFHTLAERYRAFGNALRDDGYVVRSNEEPFGEKMLATTDVLVIANALSERNAQTWSVPCPSAFSMKEITVVKQWVEQGGSLFLIADHMPFAGAARELGAAFGFSWLNCYALDDRKRKHERFFRGGGLKENDINNGALTGLRVDTIVTFTGSAFEIPAQAQPILELDSNYTLVETTEAGTFGEDLPRRKAAGWYQGASLEFGKGRVVVFGEAAMFSAQLSGARSGPMGFNQPEASGNVTLLRNIMAWLTERSVPDVRSAPPGTDRKMR
jgi:hypothetical protein